MKDENFAPIILEDGTCTNYVVGEFGTVMNIKTNKILKWKYEERYDRYYVTISVNGISYKKAIARWIAMGHIPLPNGYTYEELDADHIDGDHKHDTLSNIQWLTKNANSKKEYNIDNKHLYGEKNGNASMTDDIALHIVLDTLNGCTTKELSKKYNVSDDVIVKIRCGKTWTHITKNFDLSSIVKKRENIQHYSNEFKKSIRVVLLGDITRTNATVCKMLYINKNHKIDMLINNIRRGIKNDGGSTTIKTYEDCYNIVI